MKYILASLSIAVFLHIYGCTENHMEQGELQNAVSRIPIQSPNNSTPLSLANQRKVRNQLVIKFAPGLTTIAKDAIRSNHYVKKIKTCACADETLELWTIDLEDVDGGLEEIKGELSTHPDLEGVDYQYIFQQGMTPNNLTSSDYNSMLNLVKHHNEGVTVAIVDTGIDFNHIAFDSPLLYNSQSSGDYCMQGEQVEITGWDFVNGDNIPEDTHGHGTIIADIIKNTLSDHKVAYQILPIKSFDKNGKGTYFDILCGFRFASKKTDVDIINMSFGWYVEAFEILPAFIEEVEGAVLLICSSGNQGVNVDHDSSTTHFPSGYDYQHILSVGGIDSHNDLLAPYSNYGLYSVDLVAASQDLIFNTATETILVSGTSFANAHASAEAVLLFNPVNPPVEQIQIMVMNATHNDMLLHKTKYPKMIMH